MKEKLIRGNNLQKLITLSKNYLQLGRYEIAIALLEQIKCKDTKIFEDIIMSQFEFDQVQNFLLNSNYSSSSHYLYRLYQQLDLKEQNFDKALVLKFYYKIIKLDLLLIDFQKYNHIYQNKVKNFYKVIFCQQDIQFLRKIFQFSQYKLLDSNQQKQIKYSLALSYFNLNKNLLSKVIFIKRDLNSDQINKTLVIKDELIEKLNLLLQISPQYGIRIFNLIQQNQTKFNNNISVQLHKSYLKAMAIFLYHKQYDKFYPFLELFYLEENTNSIIFLELMEIIVILQMQDQQDENSFKLIQKKLDNLFQIPQKLVIQEQKNQTLQRQKIIESFINNRNKLFLSLFIEKEDFYKLKYYRSLIIPPFFKFKPRESKVLYLEYCQLAEQDVLSFPLQKCEQLLGKKDFSSISDICQQFHQQIPYFIYKLNQDRYKFIELVMFFIQNQNFQNIWYIYLNKKINEKSVNSSNLLIKQFENFCETNFFFCKLVHLICSNNNSQYNYILQHENNSLDYFQIIINLMKLNNHTLLEFLDKEKAFFSKDLQQLIQQIIHLIAKKNTKQGVENYMIQIQIEDQQYQQDIKSALNQINEQNSNEIFEQVLNQINCISYQEQFLTIPNLQKSQFIIEILSNIKNSYEKNISQENIFYFNQFQQTIKLIKDHEMFYENFINQQDSLTNIYHFDDILKMALIQKRYNLFDNLIQNQLNSQYLIDLKQEEIQKQNLEQILKKEIYDLNDLENFIIDQNIFDQKDILLSQVNFLIKILANLSFFPLYLKQFCLANFSAQNHSDKLEMLKTSNVQQNISNFQTNISTLEHFQSEESNQQQNHELYSIDQCGNFKDNDQNTQNPIFQFIHKIQVLFQKNDIQHELLEQDEIIRNNRKIYIFIALYLYENIQLSQELSQLFGIELINIILNLEKYRQKFGPSLKINDQDTNLYSMKQEFISKYEKLNNFNHKCFSFAFIQNKCSIDLLKQLNNDCQEQNSCQSVIQQYIQLNLDNLQQYQYFYPDDQLNFDLCLQKIYPKMNENNEKVQESIQEKNNQDLDDNKKEISFCDLDISQQNTNHDNDTSFNTIHSNNISFSFLKNQLLNIQFDIDNENVDEFLSNKSPYIDEYFKNKHNSEKQSQYKYKKNNNFLNKFDNLEKQKYCIDIINYENMKIPINLQALFHIESQSDEYIQKLFDQFQFDDDLIHRILESYKSLKFEIIQILFQNLKILNKLIFDIIKQLNYQEAKEIFRIIKLKSNFYQINQKKLIYFQKIIQLIDLKFNKQVSTIEEFLSLDPVLIKQIMMKQISQNDRSLQQNNIELNNFSLNFNCEKKIKNEFKSLFVIQKLNDQIKIQNLKQLNFFEDLIVDYSQINLLQNKEFRQQLKILKLDKQIQSLKQNSSSQQMNELFLNRDKLFLEIFMSKFKFQAKKIIDQEYFQQFYEKKIQNKLFLLKNNDFATKIFFNKMLVKFNDIMKDSSFINSQIIEIIFSYNQIFKQNEKKVNQFYKLLVNLSKKMLFETRLIHFEQICQFLIRIMKKFQKINKGFIKEKQFENFLQLIKEYKQVNYYIQKNYNILLGFDKFSQPNIQKKLFAQFLQNQSIKQYCDLLEIFDLKIPEYITEIIIQQVKVQNYTQVSNYLHKLKNIKYKNIDQVLRKIQDIFYQTNYKNSIFYVQKISQILNFSQPKKQEIKSEKYIKKFQKRSFEFLNAIFQQFANDQAIFKLYLKYQKLDYVVEKVLKDDLSIEQFIQFVLNPCEKMNLIDDLQSKIAQVDPNLVQFKKYLKEICKIHIQNQNSSNLIQLQIFMKEYDMLALQNIKMINNIEQQEQKIDLLKSAEENLNLVINNKDISNQKKSHISEILNLIKLQKYMNNFRLLIVKYGEIKENIFMKKDAKIIICAQLLLKDIEFTIKLINQLKLNHFDVLKQSIILNSNNFDKILEIFDLTKVWYTLKLFDMELDVILQKQLDDMVVFCVDSIIHNNQGQSSIQFIMNYLISQIKKDHSKIQCYILCQQYDLALEIAIQSENQNDIDYVQKLIKTISFDDKDRQQ